MDETYGWFDRRGNKRKNMICKMFSFVWLKRKYKNKMISRNKNLKIFFILFYFQIKFKNC